MKKDYFVEFCKVFKESYDRIYKNIVSVEFSELSELYKNKITIYILLAMYNKLK